MKLTIEKNQELWISGVDTSYDQQAHIHHRLRRHNTPQNNINNFLGVWISTQNNPTSQHSFDEQNFATYISTIETISIVQWTVET